MVAFKAANPRCALEDFAQWRRPGEAYGDGHAADAALSFDLDDPAECAQSRLWNKDATCFQLNEATRGIAPPAQFRRRC